MSTHADIPEWDMEVSPDGRPSFVHRGQARAYLKRFAGQLISAQFYPVQAKRTSRQNRGFHAMVTPWARERGWAIEALKQFLLGRIFGWLEFTDPTTGEVLKVLAEPHTSALTVSQFCELVDRTLELAAEDGVLLTAPDEYRRALAQAQKQAARAARKAQAAA